MLCPQHSICFSREPCKRGNTNTLQRTSQVRNPFRFEWMDAQQDQTSDNTILCIVLFVTLLIAVLWETHGMKVLRAEYVRGFHEDLEYGRYVSTPALVTLPALLSMLCLLGPVHLLKKSWSGLCEFIGLMHCSIGCLPI